MNIKYGCITLRAIEERDCDILLEMMNNPVVDKYIGTTHLPVNRENQIDWIKQYKNTNDTIRLMIELSNGKTLGMIMLQNIDQKNQTAEIGIKTYTYNYNDRISGDTCDAYKAMFKFAFEELNLHCVYSRIIEENTKALTFHKKCGFTEEGRLRSRILMGVGQVYSCILNAA